MECDLTGISLDQVSLLRGFWRTGAESVDVRKCRHGHDSCPGNVSRSDHPYCASQYEGALCAECARDFYATGGNSPCEDCGSTKGYAPTAAIGTSFFVLFIAGGAIVKARRKRVIDSDCYRVARYFYRLGKVKMRLIFFCMQTLGEFSLISTNTADSDGNGFPEPAPVLARMLGVASFDVMKVIPMGCAFPEATFYSKLFVKTVGPLVPIVPACISCGRWRRQNATRALLSLRRQVFTSLARAGFGSFLNAQMTLSCDTVPPGRLAWAVFAGFSVILYPVGQSLVMSSGFRGCA